MSCPSHANPRFSPRQCRRGSRPSLDATSARQMLHSPAGDQVLFVARFLVPRAAVVSKNSPNQEDYRTVAKFYNGLKYANHFYHESLERWFREFRLILN